MVIILTTIGLESEITRKTNSLVPSFTTNHLLDGFFFISLLVVIHYSPFNNFLKIPCSRQRHLKMSCFIVFICIKLCYFLKKKKLCYFINFLNNFILKKKNLQYRIITRFLTCIVKCVVKFKLSCQIRNLSNET